MCPFVEDEDIVSSEPYPQSTFARESMAGFFKDDKKYIFVGATAVGIVLIAAVYLTHFSMTPVNIDELPVIQAEKLPIKQKPKSVQQVEHMDKLVYDNVSGDHRKIEEKIAPQPENVVNIPELDVAESLSVEEKQNILQAFDELADEKEYKINYVQKHAQNKIAEPPAKGLSAEENKTLQRLKNKKKLSSKEKTQLSNLMTKVANSHKSEVPVDKALPPLKQVGDKPKKQRLKDLISVKTKKVQDAENATVSKRGEVMVQIASLPTKSSAESEYKRLLRKNSFLNGKGKKIVTVDLGEGKGIRYRVQVGPFSNKNEAKKVISALRDNGCSAYISR